MSDIQISEDDFLKFREFFYRKTGILFEPSKRYFVDKRLAERIQASGSEGFRDYFTKVRFQVSGEELQALINAMTVNETYFMREAYQFDCLVEHLLEDIVEQRTDAGPIRLWSLPSSSGEEPYGIAIHLLERWARLDDWDVQIISSDIDTEILAQARTGLYSARAVHHLSPALLAKYFRRVGDRYQISETLREVVEFTQANLADPFQMRHYRDFDVIFCRNLLIYFDDLSRKQAAESLYDALRPGGFLCLGHSESMSRISSLFRIRKFPQAIVYQKPREAR
ncbi:MAG: protein-glutamate O-methyltransferase CheR [Chromatiaceae bacterium]|nr:protein-glutamate O-methyltransferase CheR [Chromatiaceae bacterium]